MCTSIQMCNQTYFSKGEKKKKTIKGVYTVTEARKLTEQGELTHKTSF